MAISFRSSTMNLANPAQDPITVTVPSGVQDGDMLVMILGADSTITYSAVTGWTQLDLGTQSNTIGCGAYWRVASSEPADYSVNPSGGVDIAYMFAFNPNGGTSQFDDHSQAFNNTAVQSITSAAVTAVTDGAICAAFFHDGGGTTITSAPASMTSIQTPPNNAAAFSGAAYYQTGLSAGDITKSITWGAADQLEVVVVAISAPGGGGFTPVSGNSTQHLMALGVGT